MCALGAATPLMAIAEVADCREVRARPVSYTHLDVYKRQFLFCIPIVFRSGDLANLVSDRLGETSDHTQPSTSNQYQPILNGWKTVTEKNLCTRKSASYPQHRFKKIWSENSILSEDTDLQ